MKMLDVIGLTNGNKNYDKMLSRFHLRPERDGRTDGRRQTDLLYQYRALVWLRVKKNK